MEYLSYVPDLFKWRLWISLISRCFDNACSEITQLCCQSDRHTCEEVIDSIRASMKMEAAMLMECRSLEVESLHSSNGTRVLNKYRELVRRAQEEDSVIGLLVSLYVLCKL